MCRVVLASVVASLAAASCGPSGSTPEQEVQQAIHRGEEAAEERDISKFADLVGDTYRDESGHDRRSVVRLAQVYLLRHQSIHLLTRTQSIELLSPTRARARVLVAMAGEPIESADQLIQLRADLLAFDIEFEKTGAAQWQAVNASWRRVGSEDFL